MSILNFDNIDMLLRSQKGKIIHQVWFGTIPNKRKAKKAYESMKLYRNSWKDKNPEWCHFEWDKNMSENLVRNLYPEHFEMYKKYKYEIQRCDTIRYIILHRYGGIYADMDYYCNRPFDIALEKYNNDIYFVQSPNRVIGQDKDHVSNSLMYSKPGHPFWRRLLIEMEIYKSPPIFYTKHLAVMFTTGPGIINRVYSRYKRIFKVKSLPYKYFHPHGIGDLVLSLKNKPNVFAIHIGKGSWENGDSKVLLFIRNHWLIITILLLIFIVPLILNPNKDA